MDPKPRPSHADDENPVALPSPHEGYHVAAAGETRESGNRQDGLRDDALTTDVPPAGDRCRFVARTSPQLLAGPRGLSGRVRGGKGAEGGRKRPLGGPVWLTISTKNASSATGSSRWAA